jgi:hypothetical protein
MSSINLLVFLVVSYMAVRLTISIGRDDLSESVIFRYLCFCSAVRAATPGTVKQPRGRAKFPHSTSQANSHGNKLELCSSAASWTLRSTCS